MISGELTELHSVLSLFPRDLMHSRTFKGDWFINCRYCDFTIQDNNRPEAQCYNKSRENQFLLYLSWKNIRKYVNHSVPFCISVYHCITSRIRSYTLLAKKVVTPPLKTIKPMWIELMCFHLAEIGMIWTRDCSPTKSDTTLGRHSMQGQVGSSSSETTV